MATLGQGKAGSIVFAGYEDLQRSLEKMLGETEDLRPIWPIYHEAFKAAEEDYFASAGEGKWRANTARYARWKAKHGGGGILELTGGLRGSLTSDDVGGFFTQTSRSGRVGIHAYGHIYETSPRYMKTGTNNPVANIHFSKKGRGKRRPMDVNSQTMQLHMREAVQEHIKRYAAMWEGRTP